MSQSDNTRTSVFKLLLSCEGMPEFVRDKTQALTQRRED